MIVHPDLRALRSDDAPQRFAQDAIHRILMAWREQPEVAPIIEEITRFASGEPLDHFPALAKVFVADGQTAAEFASGFVRETARALAAEPLGYVPLRHFTDGCTSSLQLARSGNVVLSLVALDGDAMRCKPAHKTVSFGASEVWELVLAGQAKCELVSHRPSSPRQATLERQIADLRPGSLLQRDGQREARRMYDIDGTLVILRLQRRFAGAVPTREYRLADGELVHQAAGNPRDSRLEMMLALLGRMQRQDAAPLMADLACSDASVPLRWQALRESLALDTRTGFAALCKVAGNSDDPLAGPAGTLRAQLIESHPQLLELAECPM